MAELEVHGVSITQLNEGKYGRASGEWRGDLRLDAHSLSLYDSAGVKLADAEIHTTTDMVRWDESE